jgi:hypothetical protein
MPGASVDYAALAEAAKVKGCALGLTLGRVRRATRRGHAYPFAEYRELGELVVRPLGGREPADREPIVAGDFNGAATRLLRRVRQH